MIESHESRVARYSNSYCTVQFVTVVSLMGSESYLPPATPIPTTTVDWRCPVEKLQFFSYPSPHILHPRNSHFATSFTYNSTGVISHLSTNSQHVACNTKLLCATMLCVVALNLQVKAALALRLHNHDFQWHKGSYC